MLKAKYMPATLTVTLTSLFQFTAVINIFKELGLISENLESSEVFLVLVWIKSKFVKYRLLEN